MNFFNRIRPIGLFIFCSFIFNVASAQLAVDIEMDPATMGLNLVGEGVNIFNVSVTAADSSFGYYYSTGTEIGTNQGILLTTGHASNAIGPNNSSGLPLLDGQNCLNCDYFDNNFGGDPLLETIQIGETFDACRFEFDIIPQGDSLKFSYTFGSEEYNEWIGSPFRDVFGFFIQGGPEALDTNIGIIPGTDDVVSINTVNNFTNNYYFDSNLFPDGQYIQYDGLTQYLKASIGNLTPCATYHIVLVIADATDRIYDSGVFINSIESNPPLVLTATAGGIDNMIEGCNDGTITFQLDEINTEDQTITFFIDGTADYDADYTSDPAMQDGLIPNNIVIPANSSSVSINIFTEEDDVAEGEEYITIYLANPLCNTLEVLDSITFSITDFLTIDIQPDSDTLCLGDCTQLVSDAITSGNATITWTPTDGLSDALSPSPLACPTVTTTYTLLSQISECEAMDQITIRVSNMNLVLNASEVNCENGFTGTIDINVSAGIEPYEYSWTGPNGFVSSSEDLSGLEAGEYCIVITDAAECTASQCVTLVEVNELAITAITYSNYLCHPISCFGACDGSIDIEVSGGFGEYFYEWTGTTGYTYDGQDPSGLCAGNYILTIIDEAGCVLIDDFILTEPEPVIVELISQTDVLCNGFQTGSICVNAAGGCQPFSYTWSHDPLLNNPCAENLASGTYSVIAQDLNGCENAEALDIVVGGPLLPLTVVIDEIGVYSGGYGVSCYNAQDGFVNITVTGGTLDYQVEWYDQQTATVFSNAEDLSGASCGTYTLSVLDNNDCFYSTEIAITCVPQIEIAYTVVPNPCANPNAGLGGIDITSITGGNGPIYEVSYSGTSCSPCLSEDITNVNSGDYTVTVTDASGCSQDFTINIGTNDGFIVTGSITDASCFNVCDGEIDITPIPAGGYSYSWSGPDGYTSSDEDISNLCGGVYSVTATGAGCSGVFSFGIGQPADIIIEVISTTPPICFGQNNGSIDIEVTGASGIPDINWLPAPECFFAGSNSEDINGLFDCCYTVIVTDENDCTTSEIICLAAPQVMNINVQTTIFNGGYNISCNGENDGQISVFVSGGSPDCVQFAPDCYNYDWHCDDPQCSVPTECDGSVQTGLGAGIYCVDVYDANGCLATTTINLIEPNPISDGAMVEDITCNGANDGSIILAINGGSGTYVDFDWTTGNIGENNPAGPVLNNLEPGNYTLVVTDSNGCTQTFNYTIAENEPVLITINFVQQVECSGIGEGAISFSVTGGTGSYDINTVDQDGISYSGTVLTMLQPGTYTITAEDENLCQDTEVVVINDVNPILVELTVILENAQQIYDLQCAGDSNGQIISDVSGGLAGYDYEWYDGGKNSIGQDENISGLTAGFYCLIVTDQNDCQVEECIEITEPDAPLVVDADVSLYPGDFNISCFSACDGFIDLTPTGGVAEYSFIWESGDGEIILTEDVADLCADYYEVLITDNNFCDILLQFEMIEPEQINLNLTTSQFNCGNEISCFNACDGTISVDPNGGVPGYSIEWPELELTDVTFVEDLCEGTYSVIVTDDIGCVLSSLVTLSQPEQLVVNISEDYDCDTGIETLCANVSGGCSPYDINWSDGNTTNCIEGNQGIISVDILDANTCSATGTLTNGPIPEVLTGILNVTSTTCGQCNGTIELILNGGTPDFTINWTGTGTVDGESVQSDLCSGTYSVNVIDELGCTLDGTVTIQDEDPVVVDANITDVDCYGNSTGSIVVDIQGAAEPVTITWFDENGAIIGTGETISGLTAGVYSINWQDSESCFGDEIFTVNQPFEIVISALISLYTGDFNVSDYGASDGWIDTEVDGGNPGYTYEWVPATGNDTTTYLGNLPPGSYGLTVYDESGCFSDTTFVVTGPEVLELPTGLSPNDDGLNDFYVIHGATAFDNTLKIFNRWGNLVFEEKNYKNTWQGQSNNGSDLPDGTYYVIFIAGEFEFNTYVDLRR